MARAVVKNPNSDRIQKAALAAIFADLAAMRVAWKSLVDNGGSDQGEGAEISRLHESIKRWTSIYRAAR